jgi:2-polyprenyl-3-methyl-5-hydroxy-6-metoxy-1,4-benzoquinol methylase
MAFGRKLTNLYRCLKSSGQILRKNKKLDIHPTEYWSEYTIHVPNVPSSTAEGDIEFFHWRCNQYPGYLDLMPVTGHDNLDILDYGCGPGHDLIGIATYSSPKSLVGLDVSQKAINIAKQRLSLHKFEIEVKAELLNEQNELPSDSFDYIHSSGVLHHVEDLVEVLGKLRKSLRENGRIRIMVYNKDSIWWHLYVPYVLQIKKKKIRRNLPIAEAFRMSTDGAACPISNAYTFDSFKTFANQAGFNTKLIGSSISLTELNTWKKFYDSASIDSRLHTNHREFLSNIKVNSNGDLKYNEKTPGINLVLELTKSF